MKPRSKLVGYLSLGIVIAMILGACAPAATPAPTQAPATEAPAPAPTTAAPAPVTQPVGCDKNGTIVIAYDGDIDHIEPMEFRSIAAYDATANLYEPLIQQELVDKGNNVFIGSDKFVGAGAESYEVSADGTVYTFHLRKTAKFADGTPITAKDYYYTLKRALSGPGYITLLTGFMAVKSMDQVVVGR